MHKLFINKIETNLCAIEIFEVFEKDAFSFIFDSSLTGGELGKYSVIVFNPFLVFTAKGTNIELTSGSKLKKEEGNPLEYLRSLLKEYKFDFTSKLPFTVGCAGFFSYDLCNLIEKLPLNLSAEDGMPDIVLGFYNNSVIVDHTTNETFIAVSSVGFADTDNLQEALECKSNSIKHLIESFTPRSFIKSGSNNHQLKLESNFTKPDYYKTIEKVKKYIRNGDIYQVNISQRFKTSISRPSFEIYRELRKINPAPFAAYLNLGDLKVISSSPERFIKIDGKAIETRPIKGTRPRGKTVEEDILLKKELSESSKDMAEHVMIVDLERNDLGKVCKIGSVNVSRLYEIEEYATVHHLVSTVTGQLKDDADFVDCIYATFPGGSITGAPKIRSMEIIQELEPVSRNIYTGSIGYIGFNGNCDLNIAIRTIILRGNEAFYNVGGGIVWDSVPEDEFQETLDKGKALMQVLSK